MSLSPGSRLGSYEVTALIGQGGIGGGLQSPRHPPRPHRRHQGALETVTISQSGLGCCSGGPPAGWVAPPAHCTAPKIGPGGIRASGRLHPSPRPGRLGPERGRKEFLNFL